MTNCFSCSQTCLSTIITLVESVIIIFTINVYSMLKYYLDRTNSNTPPQYAYAIFNSPNFLFYCNCLLYNFINDTSNSNSNMFTLSSIADKIDNIKTLIIDSNNIINNHHTKNLTYEDTLKSSIHYLTSKIIYIPREIAHAIMDYISVIIKMITNDNLNVDYINSLFNDFNIDKSTIKEVNFKNGIAIV